MKIVTGAQVEVIKESPASNYDAPSAIHAFTAKRQIN